MISGDNIRLVPFEKYCETCKHNTEKTNPNAGNYDGTEWSGITTKEEYVPCCYCLEEAAREGTDVPMYWEEKDG